LALLLSSGVQQNTTKNTTQLVEHTSQHNDKSISIVSHKMDDISATRKLTTSETTKLRSLLKSKLNLANADDKQQAEEDASDLLDYTFAMIANGKNVKYVTDELKVCTVCSMCIFFTLL